MGTAVTELTFRLLHSQEARCREYIEKVSPRVFGRIWSSKIIAMIVL